MMQSAVLLGVWAVDDMLPWLLVYLHLWLLKTDSGGLLLSLFQRSTRIKTFQGRRATIWRDVMRLKTLAAEWNEPHNSSATVHFSRDSPEVKAWDPKSS